MTLHTERSDKRKRAILKKFEHEEFFTVYDVRQFLKSTSDSLAIQYLMQMEDAGMITGEQHVGRKRYCARKFFWMRQPWVKRPSEIRIGLHRGER